MDLNRATIITRHLGEFSRAYTAWDKYSPGQGLFPSAHNNIDDLLTAMYANHRAQVKGLKVPFPRITPEILPGILHEFFSHAIKAFQNADLGRLVRFIPQLKIYADQAEQLRKNAIAATRTEDLLAVRAQAEPMLNYAYDLLSPAASLARILARYDVSAHTLRAPNTRKLEGVFFKDEPMVPHSFPLAFCPSLDTAAHNHPMWFP